MRDSWGSGIVDDMKEIRRWSDHLIARERERPFMTEYLEPHGIRILGQELFRLKRYGVTIGESMTP